MLSYSLLFATVCFWERFLLEATAQRVNAWSDVIMVEEGESVTLCCSEEPVSTPRLVTWMMMGDKGTRWTILFSVDVNQERVNGKQTLHQAGRILEISDHISLRFTATEESVGLYSCLLEKEDKKFKERIVLLAVIKLTLAPASVIPIDSTARLKATVYPYYAVAGGTWLSRTGTPLLTDMSSAGILLTKLPAVTRSDSGTYTCNISVDGQSRKPVYSYTLSVTVYENQRALFPNITYAGPLRSLAALSQSAVTLSCADIIGDYVLLYRWDPDMPRTKPERIFRYDRWRDSRKHSRNVRLLNRSSELSGNFSFLLKPELNDAGHYQCEVFRDDKVFAQVTALTVLYGYSTSSPTSIDLNCAYKERSQVASVIWTHMQRPERKVPSSAVLGRMITTIDLPITADTAGQYACTLKLKNSQTVRYLYTAMMPHTEPPCCATELTTHSAISLLQPTDGNSTPEPSILLPAVSLLVFLVPAVAVAAVVLLWRRGPCTFPQNVERSLSHYSGEVENIYENPEDVRQSPSQNAVYMDLKLTDETDVYRELDK